MMKVEGQQVERENRGAVGAEDQKGEVWGGGCAPFPEFFFKFSVSVCCILGAI